jgi:hypothetical protein
MSYCQPNADATACARCGWCKPVKIVGWPRRNCPVPVGPEEIGRRQMICFVCEDWDSTGTQGCQLIPAYERTRLTAYKQEHGSCARACHDGKRKW